MNHSSSLQMAATVISWLAFFSALISTFAPGWFYSSFHNVPQSVGFFGGVLAGQYYVAFPARSVIIIIAIVSMLISVVLFFIGAIFLVVGMRKTEASSMRAGSIFAIVASVHSMLGGAIIAGVTMGLASYGYCFILAWVAGVLGITGGSIGLCSLRRHDQDQRLILEEVAY